MGGMWGVIAVGVENAVNQPATNFETEARC